MGSSISGPLETSTRWVDNHCHLGDDVAEVLDAARAAGVAQFIDVGCDRASSLKAIAHAAVYDGVHATVGLHPHDASQGIDGLEDLLAEPRVVAVGECGLDYHYDNSPRDAQRDMFSAQIGLANRYGLPLVIHTREAWPDTFDVLDAEGMPERTIFHCFTGGPDQAHKCLDRGGYLSFSGIASFKSATDVQEAARLCPLDRLLVETDSPYLAPTPYRGKPNQPAWVARVGEVLAELRGADIADIAAATWDNVHVAYPALAD